KVNLVYQRRWAAGWITAKSGTWKCNGKYGYVRIHNAGHSTYYATFRMGKKHTSSTGCSTTSEPGSSGSPATGLRSSPASPPPVAAPCGPWAPTRWWREEINELGTRGDDLNEPTGFTPPRSRSAATSR